MIGEIIDPNLYNKTKCLKSEYIFLSVTFDEGYKTYYYLTDDNSIEVGALVLVPAGKDNHEALVKVERVEYFSKEQALLPIEKTKGIIRKYKSMGYDYWWIGDDFVKVFINLVFSLVIIFNFTKRKENLFRAEIPKISITSAIILLVIGLVIWFSIDKSMLGFISLLVAVICFLSFFIGIGISEENFNSFIANSIGIKSIPVDEIKSIDIKIGDRIEVKFKAYGQDFIQYYNLALKNDLIKFLENHLEPNILSLSK